MPSASASASSRTTDPVSRLPTSTPVFGTMQPPATSTTLLRELGADAQSPRWAELVARYRPSLLSFLSARFPSLADAADDLVQETFLALARRLPGYRYAPDENGHFRAYLAGILRFLAVDEMRRRAREEGALAGAADLAAAQQPTDDEARAWRHAAYEVALAQYLADPAVQTRTKEIFRRVALAGEAPERVAAAYGLSRNAVDQIRSRATRKLRELAEALEGDGPRT